MNWLKDDGFDIKSSLAERSSAGHAKSLISQSLAKSKTLRDMWKLRFHKYLAERAPPRTLQDVLAESGEVDSNVLNVAPRGWQIIGDIIIVHLSKDAYQHRHLIGEGLLKLYPRCRTVLIDMGVKGAFRVPAVEWLAGGKNTETVHSENGCRFRLDAGKIMFSPGNMNERLRMSRVGAGENVLDMFAGIGYFTIPMAVHSAPKRITAVELNPVSYDYLLENIRLNGVDDIVTPVLGDCTDATPDDTADRTIMGYLNITDRQLEAGMRSLKKGGVLHYHEGAPEALSYERAISRLRRTAEKLGREIEVLGTRNVKKYSPGVRHIVVDARIE